VLAVAAFLVLRQRKSWAQRRTVDSKQRSQGSDSQVQSGTTAGGGLGPEGDKDALSRLVPAGAPAVLSQLPSGSVEDGMSTESSLPYSYITTMGLPRTAGEQSTPGGSSTPPWGVTNTSDRRGGRLHACDLLLGGRGSAWVWVLASLLGCACVPAS